MYLIIAFIINNLYASSYITLILITVLWQAGRFYKKIKFKIPIKAVLITLAMLFISATISTKLLSQPHNNSFGIALVKLVIINFLCALSIKKLKYFIPFLLILALYIGSFYLSVLNKTFEIQQLSTNTNELVAVKNTAANPVALGIGNAPTNLSPESELLVELKAETDIQNLDKVTALQKKYNISIEKAFTSTQIPHNDPLNNYYTLNIPAQKLPNIPQIIEELNNTNAFETIEYNELMQLSEIEPQTLTQFNNTTQNFEVKIDANDQHIDKQWAYNFLKINDLYSSLKNVEPQKKAKLAILDTGVDANHEDLKDNFTSTNPRHDADKVGHGTHCAGIASAVSNNKIGIASLVPNSTNWVEVTSVKVLNDNGFGTQKDIIDGIIQAADNKCDVISMSLGGWNNYDRLVAYNRAIQYANNKGSIVVVAAGNDGRSAENTIPAACDNVIVATAINEQNQLASFSNTVAKIKMGIAAPGQNIFSTIPQNQYAAFSGTSMATPYVASVVAILKAINPQLNTTDIYQILNSSSLKTQNPNSGNIIQPASAIQQLLNPPSQPNEKNENDPNFTFTNKNENSTY